ncbi:hypothetical protein EW146_g7758 [Bondarzewia mesenterica]|uniref:GSKIP domain-containing protein n=1 Tax=Bondarzewia mesenterica TaxID=1095465 RepID=A0A4S4LJN6_9AGAM|nr:hypothetical protein EW146_g7758 [Bondarzewia mesenterica]
MDERTSDPHLFFEEELRSALHEQAFGISCFEMIRATSLDATAALTILEGNRIEFTLFTGGYQISGAENYSAVLGVVYETIEDLLSAISPLYVEKKHEALVARLALLSR